MSILQTLQFGAGVLLATPSAGNLAANPSPVEIGVVQGIKLTIAGDIKELYGQLQFPVDSAVGKRSIKGSFDHAQISGAMWNQLFFADAVTSGVIATAYKEAQTIPSSSAYTVAVQNSTAFVLDQGVVYANTGGVLQRIPSGTPLQGQYLVSAGVYTFAAADAGAAVLISYTYTNGTVGNTYQINNHTMGFGPILSLNIVLPYQNTYNSLFLPNVRLGKLDLSTKLDDYTMGSTDFSAFADAAGLVGKYFLPQ